MKVAVGYCDNPDSSIAAELVVEDALSNIDFNSECDIALLFSTARHDQVVLRDKISKKLGKQVSIYGGGAVGVITNEHYGYAGDQVGIALIWLEGSACNFLSDEGLLTNGEQVTGENLGKKLLENGITENSSAMMFYDAVDWSSGNLKLMLATHILEGLEKGLGFTPDLVGAGLQGDHVCSPTKQYLGDKFSQNSAFIMNFSDDICMDSVIMHGCYPASGYYTVTKAEGSVILEINNTPAIDFLQNLLGSSITPEQYPFFLLFGINYGERWSGYDENNYASRLCLGIDRESKGIIMFEPDMVEGTEFQIMYRSLDMGYMQPQINKLKDKVGDREPIFAVYIDCAGRCAGYGGTDMEDGIIIQQAANELNVPLLGLYTGVEIATIGGKPRGLDWTGVFVVFSKRKDNEVIVKDKGVVWDKSKIAYEKDLEKELEAVNRLAEQNIAKVLELDTNTITLRHELENKRRGFRLLSDLSTSLHRGLNDDNIFVPAAQRLNAALNMQKTMVLFPDENGMFVPSVLQGYTPEEKADVATLRFSLDDELLDFEKPVLVNGADSEEHLDSFRKMIKLPYFISVPLVVKSEVAAVLITGRTAEQTPFLSRLSYGDVETIESIASLLASVLVYQKLDIADRLAATDSLTTLLNRGAFENRVSKILDSGLENGKLYAYIIIDLDYFKQINDSYGHLLGDVALKSLAKTLQNNFRVDDLIGRFGGDEFVVFCSVNGTLDKIVYKVERLMKLWTSTPLVIDEKTTIYPTLSVGISVGPYDGSTYGELARKADIALYESKEKGRNQYTVYDDQTMAK